jgi:alpha-methylacyl-CoA racemase
MAVGAREAVFHRRFLDSIGLPDQPVDFPADQTEQRRTAIARQFRQRTQDEWTATFDGVDACVDAVQSIGAAGRDPGLRERETYRVRDGGLESAPAPRLSRTPAHTDPTVSTLTRARAAVLWTEADSGR